MKEVRERLSGGPGSVVPDFQLDWDYPVWQLRFDEASGLVAVECRDADTLQTSFSVFQVISGNLILRDYKPANAWWASLAEIQAGFLYLQGVSAKGVGRPGGLTAVTVATGQVKWQRPEYSYYGLTATEMLVLPATGDATELASLNPETGKIKGTGIDIADGPAKMVQRRQAVQLPQRYPEGISYFGDLKEFIHHKTGFIAHSAIDYLEFKNYFAIGFYAGLATENLVYRLALFTVSGECRLQEILGKELTGIGPDNFFIFQDTLILLKNKNSFLGYVV